MGPCGGLEVKVSNMESLRGCEGMQVTLSAKMHKACDLGLLVCCHIIGLQSAKVLKDEGVQIPQHQLLNYWAIIGKLTARTVVSRTPGSIA